MTAAIAGILALVACKAPVQIHVRNTSPFDQDVTVEVKAPDGQVREVTHTVPAGQDWAPDSLLVERKSRVKAVGALHGAEVDRTSRRIGGLIGRKYTLLLDDGGVGVFADPPPTALEDGFKALGPRLGFTPVPATDANLQRWFGALVYVPSPEKLASDPNAEAVVIVPATDLATRLVNAQELTWSESRVSGEATVRSAELRAQARSLPVLDRVVEAQLSAVPDDELVRVAWTFDGLNAVPKPEDPDFEPLIAMSGVSPELRQLMVDYVSSDHGSSIIYVNTVHVARDAEVRAAKGQPLAAGAEAHAGDLLTGDGVVSFASAGGPSPVSGEMLLNIDGIEVSTYDVMYARMVVVVPPTRTDILVSRGVLVRVNDRYVMELGGVRTDVQVLERAEDLNLHYRRDTVHRYNTDAFEIRRVPMPVEEEDDSPPEEEEIRRIEDGTRYERMEGAVIRQPTNIEVLELRVPEEDEPQEEDDERER
ncbi:MAG: hypothetical protein H6739_15600 [Alphaproteobacteria bacterium]|nr:hypothetical protein [Alphaproteobacteria bacterium]